MISVDQIKEMYPEGTKVKLIKMEGEPQMPADLLGTVKFVDDIGQIHVDWENGSTLALNEDDSWITIDIDLNKK